MYLQKQLNDCTYYFDAHNSVYLIVGKERAAIIDTGMEKTPFIEEIRKITDLPLIVLLTHGHPDHIGRSADFEDVYLAEEDAKVYQDDFNLMPIAGKPIEEVHLFEGTPVFDLGGLTLEVIRIGGHTPGSVVYVDRKNKQIFTGDALGAGVSVWLQLPESLPVREYRENLKQFKKTLTELGFDEHWQAYSGHYLQMYRHPGYDDNPINIEMIDDAIKLCDMALNNSVEHQPSQTQNFGVPCFEVSYRHMTFVLNDQKLEREKNEENECTQNVGCS